MKVMLLKKKKGDHDLPSTVNQVKLEKKKNKYFKKKIQNFFNVLDD